MNNAYRGDYLVVYVSASQTVNRDPLIVRGIFSLRRIATTGQRRVYGV